MIIEPYMQINEMEIIPMTWLPKKLRGNKITTYGKL
jgi:hypothetical protein